MYDMCWGLGHRWAASGVLSAAVAPSRREAAEFIIAPSVGPSGSGTVALITKTHAAFDSVCPLGGGNVFSGTGIPGCGGNLHAMQRGEAIGTPSALSLWVWPPALVQHGDVVEAWCDMRVQGGGWTRVFATSGDDGTSDASSLAQRVYAPGTRVALRGAQEVMLARVDLSGSVIDQEYVVLPMPDEWRFRHPASFHSVDLAEWSATTPDGVMHSNVTLRFGFGGLETGSSGVGCDGAWERVSVGAFAGRVCLLGLPDAPAWFGFSSRFVVDVCGPSVRAADVACTPSNGFAIFVR
mgnify:CR=1 FL=1